MNNNITSQDGEVLVLEVSSESEAREKAASHWSIPESEVVLKVIEEGKSFFGLFGKKMKIEAHRVVVQKLKPEAEEVEKNDFLLLLKKVIKAAELDLQVNLLADGSVNLTGADSKILLAGRQGEGLKALDYIVNLMARNEGPAQHVRLDCEGYRRRREKELERIAMDAAKEAMKTRRTVFLQPMTSWERRIVHLTLRESSNVETHSIGVEPGRKVAVRLIGSSSPLQERRTVDTRHETNFSRRGSRSGRSDKNDTSRGTTRPRRSRTRRSDDHLSGNAGESAKAE